MVAFKVILCSVVSVALQAGFQFTSQRKYFQKEKVNFAKNQIRSEYLDKPELCRLEMNAILSASSANVRGEQENGTHEDACVCRKSKVPCVSLGMFSSTGLHFRSF